MVTLEFVRVMPLADLPEGRMQACSVGGRDILLCHLREGVYAVDNVCTHAFSRLSEGRLRGTRIICPLHGASFDVRDGRVLGAPALVPLVSYPVRVDDDAVEVALPATDPPLG